MRAEYFSDSVATGVLCSDNVDRIISAHEQ